MKKEIIKVNVKTLGGLTKCERLIDDGFEVVNRNGNILTLEREPLELWK